MLRSTPESPLTIAAMTEEAFLAHLESNGLGCLITAGFLVVLGLLLVFLALSSTLLDCNGSASSD